jgi:aspartyl-tRNA(Asn)/glutamyl-tRNA(Gln) amidotransferase subunit B
VEEEKTKNMNYKPIMGLEVHVELKTKSKMFCGCSADYFGKDPNTHTCPVCLGLPGALPYPNKKAIDWCVMIGLALNCSIPLFSKFDRKNYFYPDLAKGYQISQYDKPFCINGHINLSGEREIRIRRVHMEEDTGKLIHQTVNGEKVTLIDFNRSGVPLVEIVTEPDFKSAEEVKEYLQKIQQIIRYLDVSNADMEKGEMRLEPNISLQKENEQKLPEYKVEVKNINSFNFAGKAIDYEIKRQTNILNEGKIPVQETRGFIEKNYSTVSQRVKEEASDYRYFPEPDIPPIRWTDEQINGLKSLLPELPDDRIKRFVKEFNIRDIDAAIVVGDIVTANVFEETMKIGLKEGINSQKLANYIINKKVDLNNESSVKIVANFTILTTLPPVDDKELESAIDKVLNENLKAVGDYRQGKEQVLMFLVGQVARLIGKKIDSLQVKEKIKAKLQ